MRVWVIAARYRVRPQCWRVAPLTAMAVAVGEQTFCDLGARLHLLTGQGGSAVTAWLVTQLSEHLIKGLILNVQRSCSGTVNARGR